MRNVKLTCKLFLAIVCNSYDSSKPTNTPKTPLTKKKLYENSRFQLNTTEKTTEKQQRLTSSNRATILHLRTTAQAAQETGWEAQFKLLAIPYKRILVGLTNRRKTGQKFSRYP